MLAFFRIERGHRVDFPNPIWVSGRITRSTFFRDFTNRYSHLVQLLGPEDQITVFFNSGGGETHTALGIYDLLISSRCKVIGVVAGTAQSAASLILQACRWRVMTKNSTLMLHKSSVTVSGSVENAQESLDSLASLDKKFYEIYAKRSGERINLIADMAYRNKYFTAKEALAANLIDEILQ